jgi:peptidoglycan L-alanyl-D-glutamate endopeptidase CwlK
MAFALSITSKRNREGVHPDLIAVSDLAIQITRIDFGHGPDSGLRTAERQNQLHLAGASPHCDGYEVEGLHQSGLALDFYAFINGHASWKPEHLAMVGAAFLQAGTILGVELDWGGLWEPKPGEFYGWDMAHIQKAIK